MRSPTEPTTIEDLPAEMIFELFKYLSLKDISTCSMVNKRFRFLYSGFRVYTLAVIEPFDCSDWSGLDGKIEYQKCYPATFYRLINMPLLSNLKRLALSVDFDLNELNKFSERLVHLEISGIALGEKKVNLNLPHLSFLAILWWDGTCPISLNWAKLNNLVYRKLKNEHLLEIKHPETIRSLRTDIFDSKLAAFVNVKSLVTRQFKVINKNTLLWLPNLKALRFEENIYRTVGFEFENAIGSTERIKRTLKGFVRHAKLLKRPDFYFLFAGFLLSKTMVDEIDFGVQVAEGCEYLFDEYIYTKNHHFLEPDAPLKFIFRLHYTLLMRILGGEIPGWFFEKFTCVDWLTASEIEDEEHFLWFAKSLKSVTTLDLNHSQRSPEFFEKLHAMIPKLEQLDLGQGHALPLSFEFVNKLQRLKWLCLDGEELLLFESLAYLVRWLSKLRSPGFFRFKWKETKFFIDKEGDSKVCKVCKKSIQNDYRTLFETEDPDEILCFFKQFSKNKKSSLTRLVRWVRSPFVA